VFDLPLSERLARRTRCLPAATLVLQAINANKQQVA